MPEQYCYRLPGTWYNRCVHAVPARRLCCPPSTKRCKNTSPMSMRRWPQRFWHARSGPPPTSGCTGGGSPRCWQVSGVAVRWLHIFFSGRLVFFLVFFCPRRCLVAATFFQHKFLFTLFSVECRGRRGALFFWLSVSSCSQVFFFFIVSVFLVQEFFGAKCFLYFS